MQPTLYLFVGYPGSGKTTIAQIIEEATGATHIWADHERRRMFSVPTHAHDESLRLYEHLNDWTAELLKGGHSVLFDTNFNFYDDREHLRSIATSAGARSVLIWVTTDRELAERRAVHESHGRNTRIYGNMSREDFTRIAHNLQPPRPEEQAIEIDGTDVDPQQIRQLLNLK